MYWSIFVIWSVLWKFPEYCLSIIIIHRFEYSETLARIVMNHHVKFTSHRIAKGLMDISIDTLADKDLKKIDEMLYVDVNIIISIDFRGQRASEYTTRIRTWSTILQKWMHTDADEILRVSFRPKLTISKRDISLLVLSSCAYVEDGCTYATWISVWVGMCVLPSLYRVFYPSDSVSGTDYRGQKHTQHRYLRSERKTRKLLAGGVEKKIPFSTGDQESFTFLSTSTLQWDGLLQFHMFINYSSFWRYLEYWATTCE